MQAFAKTVFGVPQPFPHFRLDPRSDSVALAPPDSSYRPPGTSTAQEPAPQPILPRTLRDNPPNTATLCTMGLSAMALRLEHPFCGLLSSLFAWPSFYSPNCSRIRPLNLGPTVFTRSGLEHLAFNAPRGHPQPLRLDRAAMDIIIIAAGLTILLARDVFRTVRRKRREKKIKKRLIEVGIDPGIYTPAEYAYLTSSSRQYYDYRDHMHRFHHPPPGIPIPAPRTSPNHPDRGVVPRRYGEFGRSRTVDGSEYVERLGTPPPPYTPPPRISMRVLVLPRMRARLPHSQHAYTTDASGMSAEAQRKEQGLETVIEYVNHQMHPGRTAVQA
ncbi:hypothetical protein NMY22_g15757 [Coprinellus aureogranulatus]|nr:hypothetical protein NMY22_g15757 [Coprinellus aureogranulatus]